MNRRPGDYAYHYNFRYPLSVWFVVWTLSSLITKCVPSSLYTLLLLRNLGSVLACLKPSPNLTHSMYYDMIHNTQPIKYKDNYFMLFCLLCGKQLTGQQSKFCCRKHMLEYNNANIQSYAQQKVRAISRKRELIHDRGGKCSICGYDKNIAALHFHHIDASNKKFNLDGRHLSNNTMHKISSEADKCILVCANCHAEIHHPDLSLHIKH